MKKIILAISLLTGNAFANPISLPIDMANGSEGPTLQQKAQKVQVDLNSTLARARIAANVGFSTCGRQLQEAEKTLGASEVKQLNRTFCLNLATKSLQDMNRVRQALKVPAGQDVFAREGFLVRINLR